MANHNIVLVIDGNSIIDSESLFVMVTDIIS